MKKIERHIVDFPDGVHPRAIEIKVPCQGTLRFAEFKPYNASLTAHELHFYMEVDLEPRREVAKGYVKGRHDRDVYDDTLFLIVDSNAEFDAERAWYWMSIVADNRLIHIYEQVRT